MLTTQQDNNNREPGSFLRAQITKIFLALKYELTVSNNKSKHEVLIAGLRMASALNVEQLIIRGDSKVVFGQVTGSFEAKKPHMKKYAALVKGLLKGFKITWFDKIDRKDNQQTDELSKAIIGEPI